MSAVRVPDSKYFIILLIKMDALIMNSLALNPVFETEPV